MKEIQNGKSEEELPLMDRDGEKIGMILVKWDMTRGRVEEEPSATEESSSEWENPINFKEGQQILDQER